jgi:hypothetical protein
MSGQETVDEQEVWRTRLKEAEQQYRDAKGDARESARQEYLRVLRIFSDLVIRGMPPAKRHAHS